MTFLPIRPVLALLFTLAFASVSSAQSSNEIRFRLHYMNGGTPATCDFVVDPSSWGQVDYSAPDEMHLPGEFQNCGGQSGPPSLSVSPANINLGQSVSIQWSGGGSAACTSNTSQLPAPLPGWTTSGFYLCVGSGECPAGGSVSPTPTARGTYILRLECVAPGSTTPTTIIRSFVVH